MGKASLRVLAAFMDDTGFTIGRGGSGGAGEATFGSHALHRAQPVEAPARWVPSIERKPWRGLDRRWTIGLSVAALLHLAAFVPLVMVRPMSELRYEDEVMTLRLDLVPPAPEVRETPRPAEAPKTEALPPPVAKPLPFTPREARAEAPAPAEIPPLVVPTTRPAEPVRAEPVRAAPPATVTAPEPSSAVSTTPTPEFQRKVLAALQRALRYPPAARARRLEGTAVVAFTMNRQGRVLSATIQTSSGSPELDRAALETVRRAGLPRVPAELSDPLRLVVPVEFDLKN